MDLRLWNRFFANNLVGPEAWLSRWMSIWYRPVPFDHWSPAVSSSVSTWMGDRHRNGAGTIPTAGLSTVDVCGSGNSIQLDPFLSVMTDHRKLTIRQNCHQMDYIFFQKEQSNVTLLYPPTGTRTPRRIRTQRLKETNMMAPPTISITSVEMEPPNKSTTVYLPPPPPPSYNEYHTTTIIWIECVVLSMCWSKIPIFCLNLSYELYT